MKWKTKPYGKFWNVSLEHYIGLEIFWTLFLSLKKWNSFLFFALLSLLYSTIFHVKNLGRVCYHHHHQFHGVFPDVLVLCSLGHVRDQSSGFSCRNDQVGNLKFWTLLSLLWINDSLPHPTLHSCQSPNGAATILGMGLGSWILTKTRRPGNLEGK